MSIKKSFAYSILFSAIAATCQGEDWPGWMGKNRDGEVTETGYLKTIPKAGLKNE